VQDKSIGRDKKTSKPGENDLFFMGAPFGNGEKIIVSYC
jgi:hypothetical protein